MLGLALAVEWRGPCGDFWCCGGRRWFCVRFGSSLSIFYFFVMCFWFYLGIRVKFEVGMNREWIVKMKIDWKWWKDVLCRNDLLARKGCYVESEYTNRKRIFVSFFWCRWFLYRVKIRVAMGWFRWRCWVEFCLFGWRLDFRSGFKLGKKIFIIFLFFSSCI